MYRWISPVVNAGDAVTYTDGRGRERAARCMEVLTRYVGGVARHKYILRDRRGKQIEMDGARFVPKVRQSRRARG